MKTFLKVILGFLLFLSACVLMLKIFGYDYVLKGIRTIYLTGHTTAFIDDYPYFENRVIEAGAPKAWPLHKQYNEVRATEELLEINDELGTTAFLIIKNDSVWYERYAEDYGINDKTNSFSMAKSIVSALLGKAINNGAIKGLNQPVADFLPQFGEGLTVGDLASMASGLNWEENYFNPFSMTAQAYFGKNIKKQILDLEVVEPPGQEFKYLSGNTQLLAMVLQKATGQELSHYLSEYFWTPMGMRNDALWQLDSKESGMEKAYCCIASSARNFARFGKLYKDYGKWNETRLLDSAYVATSIKPRFKTSPQYGYGFWLDKYKGKKLFYMRGILGQYVIVIPEDDLIITRLGQEKYPRNPNQHHSPDFYTYIEETYRMLGKPF